MFGVCRVIETKLQVLIYDAVEIKHSIMISLLKQTLFLVTPMDIETKLYSLIDLAGNGGCNKSNRIFVACFSPMIWLIV